MIKLIELTVAAAAVASLAACSGGGGGAGTGGASSGPGAGGGGTCPPYVVPAGTDLTQPVVSLKSDVMTVFNGNCGAVGCHGTVTGSMGGLFLGAESAMKTDAAQVYAGLLGHDSNELTSMPFITAGDPSQSYLMHKMDGDQCQYDARCVTGSCLAVMPNGLGHVLPAQTRDIVRRWIAQGAKDN